MSFPALYILQFHKWLFRKAVLLFVLVFLAGTFFAVVDGQPLPGNTYLLQQGSANVRITCMDQHTNGYLLVGTQVGLFAFNGTSFEKLIIDTAIGSQNVTAICRLPNNEVWLGFQNGALGKLNGKRVVAQAYEEGRFGKAITDIMADSKGRVWCATAGEGVYCFEVNHWYNFNTDDGMSDSYVYQLLESSGTIMAGTDAGINMLGFSKGKKQVSFITSANGLSDNISQVLTALPNRYVVVGHQDKGLSLLQYSGSKGWSVVNAKMPWHFGAVLSMTYVQNKLYVATSDSGLVEANVFPANGNAMFSRLQAGLPAQLTFADSQANLWLASYNKLSLSLQPHLHLLLALNSTAAASIHASLLDRSGGYWYGIGNTLHYFNPKGAIAAHHSVRLPLPSMQTEITSLYEDESGILWVGTMGSGLWLADPGSGAVKRIMEEDALSNDNILSIAGSATQVWVSSLAGATRFDLYGRGNTGPWPAYTSSNFNDINTIGTNYIYNIFVDSKGRVWFATDGKGISVMANGIITHYTTQNGLASNVVYSIAEDSKNRIWVNVLNGGLNYFDGKAFKHFGTEDGLSDNNSSSLLSDAAGNIIAISRNAIDEIDANRLIVQSWNSAHGITEINTDLHSASAASDGIVFVAEQGIWHLQPNAIVNAPSAFIDNVELYLNSIDWTKFHHFASDENNLGLHFNAVDFLHPGNVQFQYMLEGLSNEWITTKDRYVNFPKLPPGDYVFKIRAASNSNFNASPVATYAFHIQKPFWQQWWFIVLASVVLAASIWAVIRVREKQQQHLQQLRQAHLQSQLETLKSQVSPHFFFNSLNTLMALIEDDRETALDYTAHLSDFFRKVVQYRDEDTIKLQDEINLINDYFFIQQKRFGSSLILKNMVSNGSLEKRRIAPLTLQLLVENAIKHNAFTKDKPLTISLSVQNEWLVVTNNLQPKMHTEPGAGMGLPNIQNRYRLLTGKEVLIEQDGKYFSVSVPLI